MPYWEDGEMLSPSLEKCVLTVLPRKKNMARAASQSISIAVAKFWVGTLHYDSIPLASSGWLPVAVV